MRGAPLVTAAALVLAAAVVAPAVAAAQEPDTAAAPRPFVPGGVDDKPYLTRLLGRTALGGYADVHARFERVDGVTETLGFEARRLNLFTFTRVSDFVRIGTELEIEEGGEEILLEYAAVDLALHPAVSLRGGMLLVPLGRFNLAHDSPRNDFTDRPLVATELLGVALSQPGFGFLGLIPTGGTSRLTYELYAVNGFGEGVVLDAPGVTRIPAGRQNLEDENASPAVVGRIAWSPREGFEVGASAHHGAWNVWRLEGVEVDERRDLTLAVMDVELPVLGFAVQGEAARATLDVPPSLRGLYATSQRGFYLQAVRPFGAGWVRAMPGSSFSAGARLEWVDFDPRARGDSVRRLTVGLQFRPTSDSVLKLDYLRGQTFDDFNNRGEHAGLLLSLATYF